MRVWKRSLLAALFVSSLAAAFGIALGGDRDVAKLLVKKAEKAWKAKDWAKAADYYGRAIEEYSPYPAASFGLGRALEKLGRSKEALDAYLACRDAIRASKRPSRSERRLLKQAEKAIRRLGAGYEELAKIDEEFRKGCIAFGRRYLNSAPEWSKRAFQNALALDPGNRLVQGYLERLADVEGPGRATGAFEPLIRDDGLSGWDPGVNGTWSCAGGVMTGDLSDSAGVANIIAAWYSGTYAFRAKVRILEARGPKPVCGLMFGIKKDLRNYGHLLVKYEGLVTLSHFTKAGNEDVRSELLHRFDYSRWHRLRIEVEPGEVRCFLDGKKVYELTGKDAGEFDGSAGIFIQQCRIQVKDVGVRR